MKIDYQRFDLGKKYQNKNNQHRNNQSSLSFGGFGDVFASAMQNFDSKPMLKIGIIDMLSGILPKTIIDTKEKNVYAGMESCRRESSGLVINCLIPGFLAAGIAKLGKNFIMGKEFDKVPSQKIWANEETLNFLHVNWKKVQDISNPEEKVKQYIKLSLENIQGADGSKNIKWHRIGDIDGIDDFYTKMTKMVLKEGSDFSLKSKELKGLHSELAQKLKASTIIRNADGIPLRTNLNDFLRDTYSMSKAFLSDQVTPDKVDTFASKAKKLLNNKSFLAMGIVSIIALFTQKVNRRITEKQSGKKGYVGYNSIKNEELSPKEKRRLGVGKIASSAGIAAIALATMGSLKPKMLQFSGIMPGMAQARIFSAITDIGRISDSSDATELKETSFREYLGFVNLYVLGDYVQKLCATSVEKLHPGINIMNAASELPKDASALKRVSHWIKDVSVKSFDEIIATDNNVKSLNYRKMAVAGSQLAGIVYSCLALGIVVPKICAHMVKKDEQKRLLAHPEEAGILRNLPAPKNISSQVQKTYSSFLK